MKIFRNELHNSPGHKNQQDKDHDADQSLSQVQQILNKKLGSPKFFDPNISKKGSQKLKVRDLIQENFLLKQKISQLEQENNQLRKKLQKNLNGSAEFETCQTPQYDNSSVQLNGIDISDQSMNRQSINQSKKQSNLQSCKKNNVNINTSVEKADVFDNSSVDFSIAESSSEQNSPLQFGAEKHLKKNFEETGNIMNRGNYIFKKNSLNYDGVKVEKKQNQSPGTIRCQKLWQNLQKQPTSLKQSAWAKQAHLQQSMRLTILMNKEVVSQIQDEDQTYLDESFVYQNIKQPKTNQKISVQDKHSKTPKSKLKKSHQGGIRKTNVNDGNKSFQVNAHEHIPQEEQHNQEEDIRECKDKNEIKKSTLDLINKKYIKASTIKEETNSQEASNQGDSKSIISNYRSIRLSKKQSFQKQETKNSDKSTYQNSDMPHTNKQYSKHKTQFRDAQEKNSLRKSSKVTRQVKNEQVSKKKLRSSNTLEEIIQKNESNNLESTLQQYKSKVNCLQPVNSLKKCKSSTDINLKLQDSDHKNNSQQFMIEKLVDKIKTISAKNKQLGSLVHVLKQEICIFDKQTNQIKKRKNSFELIHEMCSANGCGLENCKIMKIDHPQKIERKQRIKDKWVFNHKQQHGQNLDIK